jgi:hypothetical protein
MSEPRLPRRGDAFLLGASDGFGVIQATFPQRGTCLVTMQNGFVGTLDLGLAAAAVGALRSQDNAGAFS